MDINLNNCNIQNTFELPSPLNLKNELQLDNTSKKLVIKSRNSIKDILNGKSNKKLVVIGPCSIHNYNSAIEYAKFLKKQIDLYSDKLEIVMRTYITKPRTTIGWKGYIYDPDLNNSHDIKKGIYLSRKLILDILKIGVPCSMEHVDTIIPQFFDDLVSWAAIGARTSESQVHRELVSGLSTPVGFKNATNGDIMVAVNGIKTASKSHNFIGCNENGKISSFSTKGNPNTHIILRGGSNGPNYYNDCINDTYIILENNRVNTSIIVDCSHDNCNKDFKKQLFVIENVIKQINQGQNKIKGIMIESNLVEGKQSIDSNTLIYGKSITDACINIYDTEKLLKLFN